MAERKQRGSGKPRVGGARDVVDERLVLHRRIDARNVAFDPTTFQFKSGGDHKGVTDRLRGIRQWNPLAAGKTMVYEYRDGRQVIADGHQRTDLAQRLMAEGHKPIKLNAFLMLEQFGWTPSDVRVYAAIKNMMESSGNSVDMAKVMRERPDLVGRSALPITDNKLNEAKHLARLSKPAFDMVVGGAAKPEVAAAVGEAIRDSGRHADMMRELVKDKVSSAQHARLYVQQALAAPQITESQTGLFGTETTQRSLLRERAAVLDRAMTQLKGDKRLFGMLNREAGAIESAGNKLAHGVNLQRATSAGEMASIVEKLSTTRGPVSTMLDEAARKMADGESASKAARSFVSGLRETAKQGGIMKLAGAANPVAAASQAVAAAETSVASAKPHPGQSALFALTPIAVAAAAAIAFDSTRNKAMAAGKDSTASNKDGAKAAAVVGGTMAATALVAGKVIATAAKHLPIVKPIVAGVAAAAAIHGGIKGYKQTGTVKGALLGAVTGGLVFDRMKQGEHTRTYTKGNKAGLTEIVHRR